MTKHTEIRYVSYSPKKMFELVADVEKYPEFLPWCIASRVIAKENSKIIADLMIGFQIFREKFRSNVSLDKKKWFIFNASPDLRQQLWNNPELMPSSEDPLRYSPIMGVLLTNADVDHTAGLINLRESQNFNLYGTERVLGVLQSNTIFNVLNPKFVKRNPVKLNEPMSLKYTDNQDSGMTVTPFAVPGKVALWLEDESKGSNFGSVEEDTIALEVKGPEGNTEFFYIPGLLPIIFNYNPVTRK